MKKLLLLSAFFFLSFISKAVTPMSLKYSFNQNIKLQKPLSLALKDYNGNSEMNSGWVLLISGLGFATASYFTLADQFGYHKNENFLSQQPRSGLFILGIGMTLTGTGLVLFNK